MFDAAVLVNLRRIGQHDRIGARTQAVHQPVPVVGGLDGDAFEPRLERREKLLHLLEVAVQFLMLETLAALIHDADYKVVAMQVDSCHQWLCHIGFLSVLRCCFWNGQQRFTGRKPSFATPPLMFISS